MGMRSRAAVLALLFACIPLSAHALMRVSELMYDLEGTDTGREWIEVLNEGLSSVDLSGFKLFEANVNHGLTLYAGSAVIAPGGYAIIADTPSKFLTDWPGWSGSLFDSSFSLSNTGESLAIKNGALTEEDGVSYTAETGAQGDGKTLSRSGTTWVPASATPGSSNAGSSPSSSDSDPEEASQAAPAIIAESPRITAYAGEDRTVVVGADTLFEAEGYGVEGGPLLNARFVWNFGDAGVAEGKRVFHRYEYPGTYVVMLSVSSGEQSTTDRMMVEATRARLALRSETDGSISLFNRGGTEVDIGRWMLRRAGSSFTLPPETVVLPGGGIRLKPALLDLPAHGATELLYPNGSLAATEEEKTAAVFAAEGLIERISDTPPPTQKILGAQVVEDAAPAMVEQAIALPTRGQEEAPRRTIVPWLAALFLTAGIGAGGVWYIRRMPQGLAEQFEIIDISEKKG